MTRYTNKGKEITAEPTLDEQLSLEIDSHEKTKAQTYRLAKANLELIANGLDALNAGKLHVVKDHMERVKSTLIKQIGEDDDKENESH